MRNLSLSDYLDLDSTLKYQAELEEAFDLLELDNHRHFHISKEEFIYEKLEYKYNSLFEDAQEMAYEEFKERDLV